MTLTPFLESDIRSERETTTGPTAKPALTMAVAYEDELTRQWAWDMYRPLAQSVGAECVGDTWWDIDCLSSSEMLLPAVTAAIQADVIIVSVRAEPELPLELYVWVDVWLPRRRPQVGTLVALIGVPEPNGSRFSHAFTYLQAVARKGHLAYVAREIPLPIESPAIRPGDKSGNGNGSWERVRGEQIWA